jgi:hypothetical protein
VQQYRKEYSAAMNRVYEFLCGAFPVTFLMKLDKRHRALLTKIHVSAILKVLKGMGCWHKGLKALFTG